MGWPRDMSAAGPLACSEEEDELLAKLSQEEEMRQKHARLEAERRDQKKREAAEKRKHQMVRGGMGWVGWGCASVRWW